MTMVPASSPAGKGRFEVTVWEAKTVEFTNLIQAQTEYDRLKKSGKFDFGEVGEWISDDQFKTFEEFNNLEDEE